MEASPEDCTCYESNFVILLLKWLCTSRGYAPQFG